MTQDDTEVRIKRMRRGDGLKVPKLADLATDLKDLRTRLDTIHNKGCYVLETSTGRRSDTADVGGMILDAADLLRKGPPPAVSRANGAKSPGRSKSVREMPREKAEMIWLNVRKYRTNADAIKAMTGWSAAAAHREFGKSGRQRSGRPRTRSK